MKNMLWAGMLCTAGLLAGTLAAGGAGRQAIPPMLDDCIVFPADHIWNTPIDTLPRAARSDDYVNSIGASRTFHPDFGAGLWEVGPIGIPFVTVPQEQPEAPIRYTAYGDESDPGPFPVPSNAPIEGGAASDGDRHVLVVRRGECVLYELYRAFPAAQGAWEAESGAVFDLSGYALRPDGWTSADAAGLPILPGLVRHDEVASGAIHHALRFTAPRTQRAYVWPALHYASSSTDPNLPPMGQRFRLRADFVIDDFPPAMQVILTALKKYGMILADNGSAWYISGAPDERWDNDMLVAQFRRLKGSDFEAVDVTSLMIDPDSGQARTTIEFTPTDWLYLPGVGRNYGGTIPPAPTD